MNGRKIAISLGAITVATTMSWSAMAQEAHNFMTEKERELCVTRAEFSHNLAKLLREKGIYGTEEEGKDFADISSSHTYYADVMLLEEIGVVNGDGNGTFRPDDLILYQEAAAMMGRVLHADAWITEKCGAYPEGYIIHASQEELFRGMAVGMESPVGKNNMQTMLTNLSSKIQVHNVIKRLGCDDYNGTVYIDCYPKHWQGYAEKPTATSNGYFKIVPEKLLYSYDNENWRVAYETVDGKRIFYNLPENKNFINVYYAWETGAFVGVTLDANKMYYSYDYINWTEGEPPNRAHEIMEITMEKYPLGIPKTMVFSDAKSGLYFSLFPYEVEDYISKQFETAMIEPKGNMVWASKDLIDWIGITIPEEVHYYKLFTVRRDIGAILLTAAVDFTDEEKAYLDAEEKTAKELGKGYDKPQYKYEKYILHFDDILKLFAE